jgi:tRNA threonylcarbamoyladenosine biosynthesis protein TsaB
MRVLALDTTTRAGSAAIVEDHVVRAERSGDPSRSHAERLPGDLVDLLQSQALTLHDVDLYGVAAGPGSFTGLRIGIATMQGLAFVTGKKIVAVSALEALAHAAADGLSAGTVVGVWMDAARHEVFSALYEVLDGRPFELDRLGTLVSATVMSPAATLDTWRERGHQPIVVIGDGATMHADLVRPVARVLPPPPLAGAIGRLAGAGASRGASIQPAAVQPVYVRRPDAILARETQRTQRDQRTQREQRSDSTQPQNGSPVASKRVD